MVDTKKHGGKRAGAGAKPKPEGAKRTISVRLIKDVYDFLQGKDKSKTIEMAIRLLMDKEKRSDHN